MIVIMIAALALQAATPAQSDAKTPPAKSTQTADKSQTATPQDDPDKKICRRQTPVGSSIEQRVCKTKAQWDVEAANAQNTANNALSGLGTAGH
jgi:hypothetical protein